MYNFNNVTYGSVTTDYTVIVNGIMDMENPNP